MQRVPEARRSSTVRPQSECWGSLGLSYLYTPVRRLGLKVLREGSETWREICRLEQSGRQAAICRRKAAVGAAGLEAGYSPR